MFQMYDIPESSIVFNMSEDPESEKKGCASDI